jgi:hypothetical protein
MEGKGEDTTGIVVLEGDEHAWGRSDIVWKEMTAPIHKPPPFSQSPLDLKEMAEGRRSICRNPAPTEGRWQHRIDVESRHQDGRRERRDYLTSRSSPCSRSCGGLIGSLGTAASIPS